MGRWEEIKSTLKTVLKTLKENEFLDATAKVLLANVPIVGPFLKEWYDEINIGNDGKASQIEELIQLFLDNGEEFFDRVSKEIELSREEIIKNGKMLTDLTEVQKEMLNVLQNSFAIHQRDFEQQMVHSDLLMKILEKIGGIYELMLISKNLRNLADGAITFDVGSPEQKAMDRIVGLGVERSYANVGGKHVTSYKAANGFDALATVTQEANATVLISSEAYSESSTETFVGDIGAEAPNPLEFVVLNSPNAGKSYQTQSKEIHIGRWHDKPVSDQCTINVNSGCAWVHLKLDPDRYVSRHHARIFREGSDIFIQDDMSKNGTFVFYKDPEKIGTYLRGRNTGGKFQNFGTSTKLEKNTKIKIGETLLLLR